MGITKKRLDQASSRSIMIKFIVRKSIRVLHRIFNKVVYTYSGYSRFLHDYFMFYRADKNRRLPMAFFDLMPQVADWTVGTGFDRHYVFHTAWAARVIAENQPTVHMDISSSLYFVTGLSAFVPVRFFDYRPANLALSGFTSEHADLTALPFADKSIASLSCMHVVEHVGLGRYGDPIDPDGDLKAIAELKRVLATGGSLLFVVPLGRPRICFNAHRVYAYRHVCEAFADLTLRQFALIPDNPTDGGLIIDASEDQADAQQWGCGCFWFIREH